MNEKYYVEGTVLREIYRNDDNDFCISILLLAAHNANEEILNQALTPIADKNKSSLFETPVDSEYGEIIISGYYPKLDKDKPYKFIGKWINHPKYGWQFQVLEFQSKQVVSSKKEVISYLSSSIFKGIGKKTAENIVDALGEDAIDLILQDKNQLSKVKGLNRKQRDALYEMLLDKQGDDKVLAPLYGFGISPKFVIKIFKKYGHEALPIIHENPYQLIIDIEGIGFLKADEIAKSLGVPLDDRRRIQAAIVYVMSTVTAQDGHTFLEFEQLLEAAMNFLNNNGQVSINRNLLIEGIDELINLKQLIRENERLYLLTLWKYEKKIVGAIRNLQEDASFKKIKIKKAFDEVKEDIGISYSEKQEIAIITALKEPFSIITGAPGTGKTTVVNGILQVYDKLYEKNKKEPVIKLASPTGRAAKRLEETTEREATTIHRLLGYNGASQFYHNEEEPLIADLIIIDEVSMLDVYLAYQLFTSITKGTKVILVGDDNQLPSVGPGQILKDLIESEEIILTRLTEIHRQAKDSSVITLAHEINAGVLPNDLNEKKADRLFISSHNDNIIDYLEKVIKGAIDKGYTARDVQVLIPMYRGPVGIDKVNEVLQQLFNPKSDDKDEIDTGFKIYRVGDKVLQLMNNPEQEVMNGDVGEIKSIRQVNKKQQITVDFDGLEVVYRKEDLNVLTHAYAMSIHKAQGSEYPVVILPITRSYWIMLQRKLIYTAITRAKKSLIIIGDYEALLYGVQNNRNNRQTTLKQRLKEGSVLDSKEEGADEVHDNHFADYFVEHNIPFSTIDEKDMVGMTPYDFM